MFGSGGRCSKTVCLSKNAGKGIRTAVARSTSEDGASLAVPLSVDKLSDASQGNVMSQMLAKYATEVRFKCYVELK